VLIATQTMLAMRCPSCGRLEYHRLSRFDFTDSIMVQLRCSCGGLKLMAARKGKEYSIQVRCAICNCMHQYRLKGALLWSLQVTDIYCPDSGMELGHLGPLQKIKKIKQSKRSEMNVLFDELTGENFFHDSKVMNKVLNHILGLVEHGLLYCQCGNYNIGLEIYPDRLELSCPKCGAVSVVYAEIEKDIYIAQRTSELELIEKGIMFLGESTFTIR
jgi:phage FluMu protein Com